RSREAPFFCRLDRLGVDDPSAGLSLSSSSFPNVTTQFVVNALPKASLLPDAKVVIAGSPVGQVMRDQAPRAAGPQHIANPVYDLATLLWWTSPFRTILCRRQH